MSIDLRRSALHLATTLLLASTAPLVHATPLNDGFGGAPYVDTPLAGTTSAARPELAGTVLADMNTPFAVGGATGVVQSRVVRETASGTLDFYWRVKTDPSDSADAVGALRLIDFGYLDLTDADWRSDGLGSVAPTTARLFNPTSYPTGAINFLFGPDLGGGAGSSFFFLHTDATRYSQTASYDLLDTPGGLSGLYATFAPAAPVPEPAPAAAWVLGLLGVGWLRARRGRARD